MLRGKMNIKNLNIGESLLITAGSFKPKAKERVQVKLRNGKIYFFTVDYAINEKIFIFKLIK